MLNNLKLPQYVNIQPVNDVTITILDIIHRPVFYKTTFRRMDSTFVFWWNILSFGQQREVG
jgi:hypothetical protein